MPLDNYQGDCEASNSSSGEDSLVSDSVCLSPRKLHNKLLNANKSRSKGNVKSNNLIRTRSKTSLSKRRQRSASSCDIDSVDETFKTTPTRLSVSSKNITKDSQNKLSKQNKKRSSNKMPHFQSRGHKNDQVKMITKAGTNTSGEGDLVIPSANSADSKRVFPFLHTPSGNLKVGPNQVVFESRRVSVLVADPKHTKVNVRAEIDNRTIVGGSMEEQIPLRLSSEEVPQKFTESEFDDLIESNDLGTFKNDVNNYSEVYAPSQLLKEYTLPRLSSTNLPSVDWNKTPLPLKTELFTRLLHRITNYINPDVEILISNEVFSCHLLVLQCYSDYFDQTKQASKVRLSEESVSPRAFMAIYNWMIYPGTDSYRLLTRENIMEVFVASQNLSIKELEEQCWTFINSDNIFSEETAFLLYSKAKEMNNSTITQLMVPRIMRFFLKLVGTINFVSLDLIDVCLFLNSNFIAVHNEIEVFMSAVRWLMHDWVNRKTHSQEVMKCIRFGWIAPWQLVDIRRNPENLEFIKVTSSSEVQQLVQDGLSFAIIKYWYGNQTQDYYHWIDVLGLKEPSQRNWIDEEKIYITYREFLCDLEIYQQPDYLEKMQLRSQQLNTKSESFPPPPTMAEFMAQRVIFLDEVLDKQHEQFEEEGNKRKEIPALKENKLKPKFKETIRTAFQNPKFFEQIERTDFQGPITKPENMLHIKENILEKEIQNPTNLKNNVENTKDMIVTCKTSTSICSPFFTNALVTQVPINKYSPAKGTMLLETTKEFSQKIEVGVNKNELTGNKKSTSPEAFKIQQSPSLKSHQKISTLFKNISKDSLLSLQHMNHMKNSSSHRNYLMEGSLFLSDEEAILVFGGIDPHVQFGSDKNTGMDIYRYQPRDNAWELVGNLPEPRHHHAVAFLKGKIFLVGGADPRNDDVDGKSMVVNTVWSYNPVTRKWFREKGMLTARKNFGLVVSNGKLYAIGGQDKKGCILTSVECFNPLSGVWKAMSSLLVGRMGLAAAKHQDLIWVAGGMTSSKSTSLSDTVECFDTRQNIWFPSGFLPFPRCFSQLFSMNDTLYLIGGAGHVHDNDDTATSIASVDVWNQNLTDWQLKNEMAIPRHGHSLAYLGTQIFIVGGVTTRYMRALSNIECFCSVRSTWVHGVANLPTPLSGHGSVTLPPASLMQ